MTTTNSLHQGSDGISKTWRGILTAVILTTLAVKFATFQSAKKKGKMMTLEQLIEQKGFKMRENGAVLLRAQDVIDWVIEQMQAGNIKPAATGGEE